MFGNKKKISQEEYDRMQGSLERGGQIIGQLVEKKGNVEADFAETRESQRQMWTDLQQISENLKSVSEAANQNAESAVELSRVMKEHRNGLQQAEREYIGVCEKLRQQTEETERLVEENKHFTTPSKYLNELPDTLKEQNQSYLEKLAGMLEYGKQMTVLALNAAIEAGRMGESGRQFVAAAEDVRVCAMQYEEAARGLREEILAKNDQIHELEETVHHLVGLLKDNNVSTAKLMRSCQNNLKHVEQSSTVRIFSDDVAPMKELLGKMRSTEEEMVKYGERNQMQIGDIEEEIRTQERNMQDIEDTITSVITAAAHYRLH